MFKTLEKNSSYLGIETRLHKINCNVPTKCVVKKFVYAWHIIMRFSAVSGHGPKR